MTLFLLFGRSAIGVGGYTTKDVCLPRFVGRGLSGRETRWTEYAGTPGNGFSPDFVSDRHHHLDGGGIEAKIRRKT